jgi:hypothetical protein
MAAAARDVAAHGSMVLVALANGSVQILQESGR